MIQRDEVPGHAFLMTPECTFSGETCSWRSLLHEGYIMADGWVFLVQARENGVTRVFLECVCYLAGVLWCAVSSIRDSENVFYDGTFVLWWRFAGLCVWLAVDYLVRIY